MNELEIEFRFLEASKKELIYKKEKLTMEIMAHKAQIEMLDYSISMLKVNIGNAKEQFEREKAKISKIANSKT